MTSKILFFVLIVLVTISNTDAKCPPKWLRYSDKTGHNGLCIRLFHDEMNSIAAESHCASEGGRLVNISTPSMRDFVTYNQRTEQSEYWVGGFFDLPQNWSPLDMLAFDDMRNYCVYMKKGNGGLGVTSCRDRHRYVCERKPGSGCPRGWTRFKYGNDDVCLKSSTAFENYNDAVRVCQEHGSGGSLAIPTSQAKYRAIQRARHDPTLATFISYDKDSKIGWSDSCSSVRVPVNPLCPTLVNLHAALITLSWTCSYVTLKRWSMTTNGV